MFKGLIDRILKKTKKVVTLQAPRTSSGEFLLKKTDFGLIRVDFAVIQKIAERALQAVAGIKDSTITVEKLNVANPLKIYMTASLLEGYSAPRISEAADKAINGALREHLQLEFYVPVDVKVKELAAQVVKTKRRVR